MPVCIRQGPIAHAVGSGGGGGGVGWTFFLSFIFFLLILPLSGRRPGPGC